jgi:hypothetical protein
LEINGVSFDVAQGSTRWLLGRVAVDGTAPGRGGEKEEDEKAESTRAGVESDTTSESEALVPPLYRHGQLDKQTGRKWCGYCNRPHYNKNFARP